MRKPVVEWTLQIWHLQPPLGRSPCGPVRRTMICYQKEAPGTSEIASGLEADSEVGKRRRCSTQSGWSFDKNLEPFA